MRRTAMATFGNPRVARAERQNRPAPEPSAGAPAISVVIVNYRTYEELDECLGSLLRASGADREVVVVDHSSSPQELEHRLSTKHPQVPERRRRGEPRVLGRHRRRARDFRPRPAPADPQPGYAGCSRAPSMPSRGDPSDASIPTPPSSEPEFEIAEAPVQRSARRFPTMLTGAGRPVVAESARLWPGDPLSRRDSARRTRRRSRRGTSTGWRVRAWRCQPTRSGHVEEIGRAVLPVLGETRILCERLKETGLKKRCYLPSAVVVHGVGRSRRHARGRVEFAPFTGAPISTSGQQGRTVPSDFATPGACPPSSVEGG